MEPCALPALGDATEKEIVIVSAWPARSVQVNVCGYPFASEEGGEGEDTRLTLPSLGRVRLADTFCTGCAPRSETRQETWKGEPTRGSGVAGPQASSARSACPSGADPICI